MLTLVFVALIFLANFISAFFLLRFPALQPSVEPTVWTQVEFIVQNFPNLSWYPFWYLGFPFKFSGPPVFVYLLAFFNKFLGVEPLILDGVVSALSLGILAVGFYFLAKFLTKNSPVALISVLIFTIVPSVGYIFPQAAQVGADFSFLPWRISGFLTFGGGAKLAGFAILPYLILLFWQEVNNFSRKNFVLTTFLATFLLLTDFSVFISFVIFAIAIIATEGLKREWLEKFKRGGLIIITAAGLAAFWYTPGYLANILVSPSLAGVSFGQIFVRLFQFAAVAIPVFLAVFGFWAKKLEKNQIFVILALGFFGFLTLLWWATDTDFLTLYSRFFTEIDLVIALAIGLIIKNLKLKVLGYSLKLKNFGFLIVILIFSFLILNFSWRIYEFVKTPKYNLGLEKSIAQWLSTHVSPAERVYLSGSTAFWLNWFAPNVSQVRGGVDQAATHPYWADASFNLREGEDADTALAWLKALRVKFVVVHNGNSAEFYHDFKNPEKFEDIGRVVFDNGVGDKIFQISTPGVAQVEISTPGVAQVVDRKILNSPKPENGADFTNLAKYVAVLEQGRQVEFEWLWPNKILVRAKEIGETNGISLGITYDSGWNAECRMQDAECKVKIKKDPIGNIFLDVQERVLNKQGVEIELEHGPRRDNWVGYFISAATWFLILRPKYAKKLFAKLPKLHVGLEEE